VFSHILAKQRMEAEFAKEEQKEEYEEKV